MWRGRPCWNGCDYWSTAPCVACAPRVAFAAPSPSRASCSTAACDRPPSGRWRARRWPTTIRWAPPPATWPPRREDWASPCAARLPRCRPSPSSSARWASASSRACSPSSPGARGCPSTTSRCTRPPRACGSPRPSSSGCSASLPPHVDAVVVHPDTLVEPAAWRPLGHRLVLENMDGRKPVGQRPEQLAALFAELPAGPGFCLDVAHAAAVDPSMALGHALLDAHGAAAPAPRELAAARRGSRRPPHAPRRGALLLRPAPLPGRPVDPRGAPAVPLTPLDRLAARTGEPLAALQAARARTDERLAAADGARRRPRRPGRHRRAHGVVGPARAHERQRRGLAGRPPPAPDAVVRPSVDDLGRALGPPAGTQGIFNRAVAVEGARPLRPGRRRQHEHHPRRLLFLLESVPLLGERARRDAQRAILAAYLEGERRDRRPPRFLLTTSCATGDDLRRLRGEARQGSRRSALRHAKLRTCAHDALRRGAAAPSSPWPATTSSPTRVEPFLLQALAEPPTDRVARAFLEHDAADAGGRTLGAYDRFLALIDDPERRGRLEAPRPRGGAERPRVPGGPPPRPGGPAGPAGAALRARAAAAARAPVPRGVARRTGDPGPGARGLGRRRAPRRGARRADRGPPARPCGRAGRRAACRAT